MFDCKQDQSFYKYFKQNMDSLGLYVPSSLFSTYTTAIATANQLVGALETLGKRATVSEIVGATVGFEKLTVVGALGASYYVGAVIGSIAVAAGRYFGCGASIADYFVLLERENLLTPELRRHLGHYPIVLSHELVARKSYGEMARRVMV